VFGPSEDLVDSGVDDCLPGFGGCFVGDPEHVAQLVGGRVGHRVPLETGFDQRQVFDEHAVPVAHHPDLVDVQRPEMPFAALRAWRCGVVLLVGQDGDAYLPAAAGAEVGAVGPGSAGSG
jgi:hypothetical protein